MPASDAVRDGFPANPRHCYDIAGWRLVSDFSIPALPPAANEAVTDIDITAGAVPARLDGSGGPDHPAWAMGRDGAALLTIPGLLRILIENGRRVTVHALAEPDSLSIGMLLRGPVLAVLACQRGLLPFVGSAVRFDGGALALLGLPGGGKSVLAAMMARHGHAVLTDGLCVMATGAEGVSVQPLSPSLRLWPDAQRALGFDQADMAPYRPDGGFGFTTAPSMSPLTAVPLRKVIIIDGNQVPPDNPAFVSLPPAETIGQLSATLAARPALLAGPWAARLIGQLTAVARAGRPALTHPTRDWEWSRRLAAEIPALFGRDGEGAR